MALATKIYTLEPDRESRVERYSDASATGANLTVSTPVGVLRQILYVAVAYSANPSGTVTVTVTLNSGAGVAWDTLIASIPVASPATDGVWIPDGEFWILDDDVLDVFAPLVASEESQVSIYVRSY